MVFPLLMGKLKMHIGRCPSLDGWEPGDVRPQVESLFDATQHICLDAAHSFTSNKQPSPRSGAPAHLVASGVATPIPGVYAPGVTSG